MRLLASVLAASFLVVALIAGTAPAQDTLYTLTSPNEAYQGAFGFSVSSIGDVDADGYPDVAVGTPYEAPAPSPLGAGRAYVFSGATGAVLWSLASPQEESGGSFGFCVSGAGDVDNDGHADFVLGAPGEAPGSSPDNAGRAYVISGATGAVLHALASPYEEPDGFFGASVSAAGDWNHDGHADVIVGASYRVPFANPAGEGRAYIFSGATGDTLHTLNSPSGRSGYFGNSVSGIGDVDGDGYDDVMVGAWCEDVDFVDAGNAYVFSGGTGTSLHTLVSPHQETDGHFGFSVSGVGDVDGDGVPDIVVGAAREDPGTSPENGGRAYVFSGATGATLHTLVSPHEEEEGFFGASVSGAGDWDGDGNLDVMVGAPLEDPETIADAGRAYVFDGQAGSVLRTGTLTSPNGEYQGGFGWPVSGAGDVDGDGRADVIVGAMHEDPDGCPEDAGRAYVFRWDPSTSAHDIGLTIPSLLTLHGPFPNPTTGDRVRVSLQVLESGPCPARLSLYDVGGRCVATALDRTLQGGENLSVTWNSAQNLCPGIYWWRLQTGAQSVQRAMVIAK